ncbi:ER-golgi trafficking TRAPP I complex 85 kDa subunit-domain-containing protein [Phlyctochytrium arcticum]|nr:ER-golgi trafficking TRAPP I complex 85 kDa subunit-domain-containing protein [Phlyctochytrium arcticum]
MASGLQFVLQNVSPVVAVAATADADHLAALNNLPTIADLLSPFGDSIGSVQTQDSQGHSVTIPNFPVRFRDWRHIDRFTAPTINKVVLEHLRQHGLKRPLFPVIHSKEDAERHYNDDKTGKYTPWYVDYRNCVCNNMDCASHETINHPIATLIVVSTSNPNPVAAAQELASERNSTANIAERIYLDPSTPKFFLLLHDEHAPSVVSPETILSQMRQAFPATYYLSINSVPRTATSPSDPFASVANPPPVVDDIWRRAQQEFNSLTESSVAPLKSSSRLSVSSAKESILSPTNEDGFPLFKDRTDTDATNLFNSGSIDLQAESTLSTHGNYLTPENVKALEDFAAQFVTQKIVKHMETSIQQWNEQVASNRRGLTGRLNRLVGMKYFGGGTKSQAATPAAVVDKTGNTIFPYNAPELIMRRLADYAFMMHDYKLAFGIYDSVRKDFQSNEKYLRYFAGTQEMLGLCMLVGDGVGRGSVETYLETAIAGYQETKVPMYSARAAMLYYEIMRERGYFREAAPLLIRLTGEDSDLRSAMFLEQAAISFLRVTPPMIRKYAFHMILAGHRFSKCGQRAHAYRSYVAALDVYEGREWSLVEDHIHFTLGRQCFHLGEFEAAVRFFLRLLRASRQTATQQSAYLREFLYLYKQYSSRAKAEDLALLPSVPIPEFKASSILVSLMQYHSGQPQQVAKRDEEWDIMENQLYEEGYAKTGGLRGGALPLSFTNRGKTTCAVGEPVFVTLEVYNPMNIPIQINNVSLECCYEDQPTPLSDLVWTAEGTSPEKISYEEFDVHNISEISLDGHEKQRVELRVIPKREGDIKITGIRFTLCGVVPSRYLMPSKPAPVSVPGSQRPVDVGSASLTLSVTSPMPVLDVIFHSFPSTILSGEVVRAVLEINNKGNRGLRNLQLKTSHPTFFCVGASEDVELPPYATSPAAAPYLQESYKLSNLLFDQSTFPISLPSQDPSSATSPLSPNSHDAAPGILAAGTTTLIPLWIRGDKVGKQVFRFLFGYQSEDKRDRIGYRSLRFTLTTVVQPSLRLNAFTRPRGRVLDEFILGIEVENLFSEGNLVLKQITSLSPTWAIQPIDEKLHGTEGPVILEAQQTNFRYFRFTKAIPALNSTKPLENGNSVPEVLTMRAIERLLLGEDPKRLAAPDVDLIVASLAMGTEPALSCDIHPFRSLALTSRLQWRIQHLITQYPGLTHSQLRDLFTLYFTDDIDLAVVWGTPSDPPNSAASPSSPSTSIDPSPARIGHHYILGINLGLQAPLQGLQAGLEPLAVAAKAAAGRALFESTVREKKALITSLLKSKGVGSSGKDVSPLRVVLKSEMEYQWDFNSDKPCLIPITLTICNTSRANAAKFTLQATLPEALDTSINPDARSPTQTSQPTLPSGSGDPPPFFSWLGTTRTTGRLQPEEEKVFTFMANFPSPGTYNVNRWVVHIDIEVPKREIVLRGKGSANQPKADPAATTGEVTIAASYIQSPNVPYWVTIVPSAPLV